MKKIEDYMEIVGLAKAESVSRRLLCAAKYSRGALPDEVYIGYFEQYNFITNKRKNRDQKVDLIRIPQHSLIFLGNVRDANGRKIFLGDRAMLKDYQGKDDDIFKIADFWGNANPREEYTLDNWQEEAALITIDEKNNERNWEYAMFVVLI